MSVFMQPVFRSLAENNTIVEVTLKNDIVVWGRLQYVDSNLNLHLVECGSESPWMEGVVKCFLRGSAIKYVAVKKEECSIEKFEQILHKEGQFV